MNTRLTFDLHRVQQIPLKPEFPKSAIAFSNPFARRGLTCEDSAAARGITTDRELKSILLKSRKDPKRRVMAHVLGNCDVDLKEVARLTGFKVKFLNENELLQFSLEKCRVNPFTARRYLDDSVTHIFCPSIVEKPVLFTNHDSVLESIVFSPIILQATFPDSIYEPISLERGRPPLYRYDHEFQCRPDDWLAYELAFPQIYVWVTEHFPPRQAATISRLIGEFLANLIRHGPSEARVEMELRPGVSFSVILWDRGDGLSEDKANHLRTRFQAAKHSGSFPDLNVLFWSMDGWNRIHLHFDLVCPGQEHLRLSRKNEAPQEFDLKVVKTADTLRLELPSQCHVFHPDHPRNHQILQECYADERELILDARRVDVMLSSASWPLQLLLRKRCEAGRQLVTRCLLTCESERVLRDSYDFCLQVLPHLEIVREEGRR